MPPVSPVFHTSVTIGLNNMFRVDIHSKILDVYVERQSAQNFLFLLAIHMLVIFNIFAILIERNIIKDSKLLF